MQSRRVQLKDGRHLAFATYGPIDGAPVLHHHGAPGSRLAAFTEQDLAAEAVCLVVADRPGYGESDPHPAGASLRRWTEDAAALADHLDWPRFAVSGHSAGGSFALACGAFLTERVTSLAVVAGAGEVGDLQAGWVLPSPFDDAVRLARDDPATLRDYLLATTSRDSLLELLRGRAIGADAALYADRDYMRLFADTFDEALRQGATSYVDEFILLTQPWDLPLAAIQAPCHFWYGDEDPNPLHQPAHGRHLAERVANATFHLVPGAGAEMLRHAVARDILRGLRA
ncbi:MAG TPA: alpha/beta hydrolase [Mycobacteriales bacterium]|nr:alpha/beta hydrolase [Mycobacteriales bacterium]